MTSSGDDTADLARRFVTEARVARLTVAVAESLTAGMVASRIADVPGASAVLRGGVVAYATELKALLLDVDPALLAEHGPVHPDVAAQMALGVRHRLGADLGAATTGVAGPDPAEGHPAGTVFVAVARPGEAAGDPVRVVVRRLALPGDRGAVRAATTAAVLALLLEAMAS